MLRASRHPLVLALGCLLAAAPSAADDPAGVRLTATGDAEIRFELRVAQPRLQPAPAASPVAGGLFLVLDGCESGAAPGMPELPARVVTLAVPPVGEVRVSAVGLDEEVREGVELGSPAGDSAAAAGARPGVRARLAEVGWMRNQRIARIEVYPADYDRTARRLALFHRVDVAVRVDPAGDLGAPAESADPFEPVYREGLLNYEQGRAWRRPAPARLRRGAAARSEGLAAAAAEVPDTSVYAGRRWIKIAVQQSGFYKVTFGQLRKLTPFDQDTTVRADSLRLFTWPGVPVLPTDSYCDSCDYREVSIGLVCQDEPYFKRNEDYFYFYAMGPSDWASLYDATRPETTYVDHPYDTKNYYYLTIATEELPMGGAPARIQSASGDTSSTPPATPATYPARAHFRQELYYYPDASPLRPGVPTDLAALPWYKFLWASLKQGRSFETQFDLPGADTLQVVRLRAVAWGLNNALHSLDIRFNGAIVPAIGFYGYSPRVYDVSLASLRTVGNVFQFSLADLGETSLCGLVGFDLFYQREFVPAGDSLAFDSPAGGNGDVVYRIGPFASASRPLVFDVTTPTTPVEITGGAYVADPGGAGYQLIFQAAEDSRRRYRVFPDELGSIANASISEAPSTSTENLRSPGEQADYIVIYYDAFAAAAAELVAWRSGHLYLPGVTSDSYFAKAVPISALYDQFSGGRTDPAAIRNFLRAAWTNWNQAASDPPRAPTYVTLLGGASYDYKNILGYAAAGQPGCLIPSYEDNFDSNLYVQFPTDDWMFNVDDAKRIIPDLLGGRLVVEDAATALGIVRNKVILHESEAPFGEWRNRVLLIADDDRKGAAYDVGLVWKHLSQTAVLDSSFTPPHMDRKYVYLHTYPTGAGYTKPGARADIQQDIADGVALINFVGHGGPMQIADERVLLNNDVGSLANAPRFPLFLSASCAVGKFTDPTVASLGKALLSSTTGGAVGVIAATEEALAESNALLNQAIYGQIFARGTPDCHYHVPLSAALLAAKNGTMTPRKYQLMGDAAVRILLPRLWVDLEVTDSLGTQVTEVRRGQTLSFRGRVRDCPAGAAAAMDGVARLLIEDSQELGYVKDSVWTEYQGRQVLVQGETYYDYRAGTMFRGDVSVRNGEFSGRFVVPAEAAGGPRGKVRAYVEGQVDGEDTDGVGSVAVQVSPDTSTTGPADTEGPLIRLGFVGGSTEVRPDAVLKIDLSDESGILTTDHLPQNGIIVTLDENSTTRTDVTASFRYAANSYQSGVASFTLPDLSVGAHTVTVSAADNLALGLSAGMHRSKATLAFTVAEEPILRVRQAYLFPNPAESGVGGRFVVDAPGDSVNLLLRIYSASGRLIRRLTVFGGLGQVQVPWDGLDEEGQPLANGVYFFRVHVNPRDTDGTSSPRQKADADGRFVIVNRK